MMDTIDLLPQEYRVRRTHKRVFRKSLMGTGLFFAVVVVLLFGQQIQLAGLRAEVEDLTEAREAQQRMKAMVEAEDSRRRALEDRVAIILNALEAPRWGEILVEISAVVPQEIWLESLMFTPEPRTLATFDPAVVGDSDVHDYGEVRLQGTSVDGLYVARLVEALKTSPNFHGVNPVNTEASGTGRQARFTVVGRLVY